MRITDVQIRLAVGEPSDKKFKLLAFCSIVIDDGFIIYDLKLIQGNGGLFVAMPSRKITDRCVNAIGSGFTCSNKNDLTAVYCGKCGCKLPPDRSPAVVDGKSRTYVDVAHPVNWSARQSIHTAIVEAYKSKVG